MRCHANAMGKQTPSQVFYAPLQWVPLHCLWGVQYLVNSAGTTTGTFYFSESFPFRLPPVNALIVRVPIFLAAAGAPADCAEPMSLVVLRLSHNRRGSAVIRGLFWSARSSGTPTDVRCDIGIGRSENELLGNTSNHALLSLSRHRRFSGQVLRVR